MGTRNLRQLRLALWVAVAVALTVTAWLSIHGVFDIPEPSRETIAIGGPFTMVDHTGRTVTEKDLHQKAMALFAGFTYCPDVCPTTLTRLASLVEQLGDDADKIQVVLFSVDPDRDTPESLKTYLSNFSDRFIALSGTTQQTADFAKAYRIFYEKVPQENGDYTMNHTAGVFLFRKGGEFQGTVDAHENDEVALRKLRMAAGL